MTGGRQRRREMERWIAWIRLGAVPFAVFQVALSSGYPGGYRTAAWVTAAAFAAGAAVMESVELFLYLGDRHLFADDSLADYDENAVVLLTERVLSILDNIE